MRRVKAGLMPYVRPDYSRWGRPRGSQVSTFARSGAIAITVFAVMHFVPTPMSVLIGIDVVGGLLILFLAVLFTYAWIAERRSETH